MKNVNAKKPLLLLLLTVTVIYQSCAEKNRILNTTDTSILITYRNISQDLVDSLKEESISKLFGTWYVNSIANVGGTLVNDSLISSQFNKRLYFNKTKFQLFFLGKVISIENPSYSVEYINANDNIDMGFTTFFYGYEPCRKNIVMINVSKKIYLEVTNLDEIAYFYDGRIYFFTKLNSGNK